jgi:hypothetical protein
MLAPGATIFDQDGTLQSADTKKRWCDTCVRFPKQPSHSWCASILLLVGRIVHGVIFEIVSELGGDDEWFANS